MSHSQFRCISLYLDMHGLVFETSIWLLAGSTRLLSSSSAAQRRPKASMRATKQELGLSIVYVPSTAEVVTLQPFQDLCFRDLQPTRYWIPKRRWDSSSAVSDPASSTQTYSTLGFRPGRSRICTVLIIKHYSHTSIQQSTFPSRRASDTTYALITQRSVVIKNVFGYESSTETILIKALYVFSLSP